MHREKPKWRADRGARALKRIADIEGAIVALGDGDLLDLADIFASAPSSPLGEMASAEVARRNIGP